MRSRVSVAGALQQELANSSQHVVQEVSSASHKCHSADALGSASVPQVRVLVAFSIIACVVAVVQVLELSVTEDILIAGIRCFVQFNCLGMILQPVFSTRRASVVLAYAFCFMVPLASYEAAARSKLSSPNMFVNAMCSLGAAGHC